MKQRIMSSVQQLSADRYLSVLIIVMFVVSVGLLLFLATAIHPAERQVAVHYTSFGLTNFYRDKWYYLLGFAGFVIFVAVIHTLLIYKILQAKGRDLAVAFTWLSITLLVISGALFYQILKVASIT